MYKRNSGLEDREILQNQFTAYVKRAVHNRRIRFLQDENRSSQVEISLTDIEMYGIDPVDADIAEFRCLVDGQCDFVICMKLRRRHRWLSLIPFSSTSREQLVICC